MRRRRLESDPLAPFEMVHQEGEEYTTGWGMGVGISMGKKIEEEKDSKSGGNSAKAN